MHTGASYRALRQRGARQVWFGLALLGRGLGAFSLGTIGPLLAITGVLISTLGHILEIAFARLSQFVAPYRKYGYASLLVFIAFGLLISGALLAVVLFEVREVVVSLAKAVAVLLASGVTFLAAAWLAKNLQLQWALARHPGTKLFDTSWWLIAWTAVSAFFQKLLKWIGDRFESSKLRKRRDVESGTTQKRLWRFQLSMRNGKAGSETASDQLAATAQEERNPDCDGYVGVAVPANRTVEIRRPADVTGEVREDGPKPEIADVIHVLDVDVDFSLISVTRFALFAIAFSVISVTLIGVFSITFSWYAQTIVEIDAGTDDADGSMAGVSDGLEGLDDVQPLAIDLSLVWNSVKRELIGTYQDWTAFQVKLSPLIGHDLNWREESSLVLERRDVALLRRRELELDRSLLCGSPTLVAVGLASQSGPAALNRELAYQRSLMLANVLWAEALLCPRAELPTIIVTSFPAKFAGRNPKAERAVLAFALPRDFGFVGSKSLERELNAELERRIGVASSDTAGWDLSACRFDAELDQRNSQYVGLPVCNVGQRVWLAP